MRRTTKWLVIALASLLMSPTMAIVAVASDNDDEAVAPVIEHGTGTTDLFGGGEYVYVKFGKDAMFGVVYGVEGRENSVVIFMSHARYLGRVDVYNENGALISVNKTVRAYTIIAQRLADIVEYNDKNGNGIYDHVGWVGGSLYLPLPPYEEVYKYVSLHTAWERSEITKTVNNQTGEVRWEFSLTARNLTYQPLMGKVNESEKLDLIVLTFHLTARRVWVDNATLPKFKVVLSVNTSSEQGHGPPVPGHEQAQSRTRVLEAQFLGRENVSGYRGLYKVKFDQRIEGWDYDANNTNKSLMLEFMGIAGHAMRPVVERWLRIELMRHFCLNTSAVVEAEGGKYAVNESIAQEFRNDVLGQILKRKLKSPFIRFENKWERIATLHWVTNVTVDNAAGELHVMVAGGFRHGFRAFGMVFHGFKEVAAFCYPGGNVIVHDPDMYGEALLTIESKTTTETEGKAPLPIWEKIARPFVLLLVIAIAVIVIVAVLAARSGGKKPTRNGLVEMADTRERIDWESTYTKRR